MVAVLPSVSVCIYVAHALLTQVFEATHQPLTTLSRAAQPC